MDKLALLRCLGFLSEGLKRERLAVSAKSSTASFLLDRLS
jgi:hypothetical protein